MPTRSGRYFEQRPERPSLAGRSHSSERRGAREVMSKPTTLNIGMLPTELYPWSASDFAKPAMTLLIGTEGTVKLLRIKIGP